MNVRRAMVLVLVAALCPWGSSADAATGVWTNGRLYGGTTYTVVAHPNRSGVVYAGTSHGLFISRDGAGSWHRGARLLRHAEAVKTIAFAPSAPAVVYVGATSGLYRSVDDGVTWTRRNAAYYGGRIEVHPRNANVVFAHDSDKLSRSVDGGVTWTLLSDEADEPLQAAAVRLAPSDPSRAYAIGSEAYRSADGGRTWTTMSLPHSEFISDFAIDPHDARNVVVMTGSSLYRTSDGGGTWEMIFDPPPIGPTALHVGSNGDLYVGMHFQGIYRSRDDGASWRLIKAGLPLPEMVLSVTTGPGGAVYAGMLHRGVYRWSSDAAAWRWHSSGITAPHVGVVEAAPSNPAVVYTGGYRNGIGRSADGGRSWRTIGIASEAIAGLAVHPQRPNTVFAAGVALHRTTDGGQTWRKVLAEQYGGFRAVAIAPSQPSTVYAASWDHIYRSSDGGSTWHQIRDGGAATIAVHPTRPGVVFAASSYDSLVVTRDAGLTWDSTCCVHVYTEITDIEFEPGRPGRMFAATYDGVLRSDDGGRSWAAASAAESMPAAALEIDPSSPNVHYLASWKEDGPGVYRSADRGQTWQPMTAGMGRCLVAALALTPAGDVLHAGTTADAGESGQGIWSYRF